MRHGLAAATTREPPPPSATIYACDPGVVRANRQRNLDFRVRKNPDANVDDDLTFRADVIGEITLSDGTPFWFPTPQPRGDGITDRANNYSIDAVRARADREPVGVTVMCRAARPASGRSRRTRG